MTENLKNENYNRVTIDVKDNETIVNGTNKQVVYDFFKSSITVMDILNQSHSIELPLEIKEGDALLDVAMNDIIRNIRGTYKPFVYESDMFLEAKFYFDEKTNYYIKYEDVDTEEDAIELKFFKNKEGMNYFYELFKLLYNNFIELGTEFLTTLVPEAVKTPEMISNYKYEMVKDFFQDRQDRELYNQLSIFYDVLLHESVENVEIIDKDAHKLIQEEK